MTDQTPDDWGNSYRRNYDFYRDLTRRLKDLVTDLLSDKNIEVIQTEARTKTVDSFIEKITRKSSKYKDPLADITDLVGLRIITYYLEDVSAVGDILKKEFTVDTENSIDKSEALDPDQFGYASVHYIVSLSPKRQNLAEWRPYKDIRVEIQVKTALQHAWSAVHHKLDYKSPTEVPKELRRSLFRLSALFELADEQFSELRDARSQIARQYADNVRGGQLDIPLDEASIAAYIEDSGKRELIDKMIREGGGKVIESTRLARDRRDLLTAVRWAKISTIEEFDSYLQGNILAVSLAGTSFFDGFDFSREDALTTLILADKQADKKTYSDIYADDYTDFTPKIKTWQAQKKGRTGG